MVSVSVHQGGGGGGRFFFFNPNNDEKKKKWPLRFPAKENPNIEKALFD